MKPITTLPKLSTAAPRNLVGIAEVSDRLGVDIRHVRRLVHERRIPYIKWGHLLRFDPGAIDGVGGPKTKEATGNFQAAKATPKDFIVGKNTWKALLEFRP